MKVSDKGILGKIKEIRIKKGFSQDYLASKLGMKQPGYGMIENGVSKITVLMLLEIAIILEIHIIDLIETIPHTFTIQK